MLNEFIMEIALRIFLWFLFLWLDQSDPFIRQIQETEIWKYKYPITPSYVPATILWIALFSLPGIVFLTETIVTKKTEDPIRACLGITLAYGLTGVFTSYLKMLVGRPRPDFYYRCFPDGKGNDFNDCKGSRHHYLEGRRSFPSGHASLSFAAMTFLCLYLRRKLCSFNEKHKSWQLSLCFFPMVISTGVAISRTCDYHHHYEDVAVGSLLGTVIAYLSYKVYFPTTCLE